jgi:hypothetical protein
MIDPSEKTPQPPTNGADEPRPAQAGGKLAAPGALRSLQPTPEANKSRVARLRRKQRLLIKRRKSESLLNLTALPPAPDPLAP